MSAAVPRPEHSDRLTLIGQHERTRDPVDMRLVPASPPEMRRIGEVLVIRPLGSLDRDAVARLRRTASEADGPVIIDLDDCVLVAPVALVELDEQDDDAEPTELCFVSRRTTCRLLLLRSGLLDRFDVFRQLEDALQARVLALAGYGRGWRRS